LRRGRKEMTKFRVEEKQDRGEKWSKKISSDQNVWRYLKTFKRTYLASLTNNSVRDPK
jgi:hypothetical protein